jgi:dipeptidyl aminopeptidase/acylaminoacyl peptidase
MNNRYSLLGYWVLVLLLVGCGGTAVLPTQIAVASLPTSYFVLPATNTPLSDVTAAPILPTPTLAPSTTPLPSNTPTATPPPGATPDLYRELTIDALSGRRYGGGLLDIVETLEENDSFTRYLITYPSDGLKIYGFMNVPNEGDKFPVALVLHGYIDPKDYDTLAYTTRYADALAEAGYFVIHPNLRNYPPSDNGPDAFRTGYAIDVLNLIAIIRAQSQDPVGYLRRADAEHIHLWGHSMGGGIVLRVLAVNREPYIRAAVLYGSMSGDERRNYERIQYWSYGRRGDFELAAPPEVLDLISPIHYLDRITAPIAIHHSLADDIVPVSWSQELCDLLEAMNHPHECYLYEAQPHTFHGYADDLFMDRVILFFRSH